MKPISLSVAGLHSFREKQTIQFDSLCDGGIFGIFGPTGSGKSSILDAMTLALYGKVERAMNNTHGILNHAEDQLSVSFTFELENASSKKRYIVERVFKRTDDIRVKTAICRLIEEDEEHVVLADKAVDVNEKIYGLLGLTIDDFTRAVVLPQGKFAEFLSLKGAERRQMLQRLFHLEQYGDQLLIKLKRRLASTRIERNELEAEKTGLGDASAEAVEEAKSNVTEAKILLEKRQKELESVTKDFEQKQTLWNLQMEKAEIEKEKLALKKEEEQIAGLEKRLKSAEEAEALRPYAEALQARKKERNEAEINLIAAKKNYENMKEKYEVTSREYEQIRKEKAEQEPLLVTKREKLLQMQKVEEELEQEQKVLKDVEIEYNNLQHQREHHQTLLSKAEQLVEKALNKQHALKEEQQANLVSAKDRDQVRGAADARQHVLRSKQQYVETTELLKKKTDAIHAEKERASQTTEQLQTNKQQLETQFRQLNQLYHYVSDREKEYKQAVAVAKNKVEIATKEEQDAKNQKLAFELVKGLKDGEACPVCGSCSHPSPAVHVEPDHNKLDRLSETMKKQLEQLQMLSHEPQSLKVKAEGLSEQLVSEFEFLKEVKQIEEAQINELLQSSQDLSINQVFHLLQTEFKRLTQDLLQVRQGIEKTVKLYRELQKDELRRKDSISSALLDVREWEEKANLYKENYEQSTSHYSEKYSMIPFEEVEKRQGEISEKDTANEQLTERIQKSFSFIEEQQALVKEQEKMNQQLTEKQIAIHSTMQNRRSSIKEKEEKLSEVKGEMAISTQIQATEAQIKHLAEKENNLYQLWQRESNELYKLQSEQTAYEKSLNQTARQVDEAERAWEQAKYNTAFLTIEETLSSLLSSFERQQMKVKIEAFKDKMKQLNTDLKRIEEKLDGQVVSQEQWDRIQMIRDEMKQQTEEAVANKGAATKALEVLLDKHERFSEIETKQNELDDMLQKLEKLQSVFKGNSFVEYVAEEQLQQVSRDATERLSMLTRGRYAIEVDSQGGFIMRDDANGGVRRPVSTLSGGETFLTSLALALSLSTQIQLRGEYPLQFFFLDEGFGTLDVELLDTVITALEKLQAQNLSVGVISHVQELRARLPRKLIVEPAEPSGKGTSVYLESL
ncbi:SbcC/MukB-like Walker B domain-containing protein [Metabacillus schmidteae]|uniref:SbcC/MukB-like Walker B domain-containing protein n=1 Tax=Metabacillus schmidteae TaxID=2730405 RepID=UPI00158C4A77|nr:SbcC/MukB-like Walker B domain-containing protein [Metabacillus schmidteae]